MDLGPIANLLAGVLGKDSPSPDFTPCQIAIRCSVIYVAGLAMVRIGKSRLLSKSTPLDMILAIILGSVLGRGIVGSAPLWSTLFAAAVLVSLHWIFSALAYYSDSFGRLIKGGTRTLVSHGEIHWDNMRRSHLSEKDLHEYLRLNANIDKLADVELAVKERSGEIGVVIKKPDTSQFEVNIEQNVKVVRIIVDRD